MKSITTTEAQSRAITLTIYIAGNPVVVSADEARKLRDQLNSLFAPQEAPSPFPVSPCPYQPPDTPLVPFYPGYPVPAWPSPTAPYPVITCVAPKSE